MGVAPASEGQRTGYQVQVSAASCWLPVAGVGRPGSRRLRAGDRAGDRVRHSEHGAGREAAKLLLLPIRKRNGKKLARRAQA